MQFEGLNKGRQMAYIIVKKVFAEEQMALVRSLSLPFNLLEAYEGVRWRDMTLARVIRMQVIFSGGGEGGRTYPQNLNKQFFTLGFIHLSLQFDLENWNQTLS